MRRNMIFVGILILLLIGAVFFSRGIVPGGDQPAIIQEQADETPEDTPEVTYTPASELDSQEPQPFRQFGKTGVAPEVDIERGVLRIQGNDQEIYTIYTMESTEIWKKGARVSLEVIVQGDLVSVTGGEEGENNIVFNAQALYVAGSEQLRTSAGGGQ